MTSPFLLYLKEPSRLRDKRNGNHEIFTLNQKTLVGSSRSLWPKGSFFASYIKVLAKKSASPVQ
jgi:hypothetical protein